LEGTALAATNTGDKPGESVGEGRRAAGGPSSFTRSSRLRRFAESTVRNKDVQTELPVEEAPPAPTGPRFKGLAEILAKVAVILAAAGVAVLAVLIGIRFVRGRAAKRALPKKKKEEEDEDAAKDDGLKEALKDVEHDAKALAASGRFTEAIHIL
jgi:uncharacterized protein HemX